MELAHEFLKPLWTVYRLIHMVDVALFPIPNAVSFPWIPYPLHVFEPRYRQMVRHCIEQEMMMGVCHTEKLLHNKSREQSVEEALKSNQATYKPCEVFSAGPVILLQELDDGRMLIQVDTQVRMQLREEKQTLPFSIWSAEELLDEPGPPGGETSMEQCKEKILYRLLAITHNSEKLQTILKSDHWQAMPPQHFSFAVAGMLGMEADLAQNLLEMTDTRERLDILLEIINEIA